MGRRGAPWTEHVAGRLRALHHAVRPVAGGEILLIVCLAELLPTRRGPRSSMACPRREEPPCRRAELHTAPAPPRRTAYPSALARLMFSAGRLAGVAYSFGACRRRSGHRPAAAAPSEVAGPPPAGGRSRSPASGHRSWRRGRRASMRSHSPGPVSARRCRRPSQWQSSSTGRVRAASVGRYWGPDRVGTSTRGTRCRRHRRVPDGPADWVAPWTPTNRHLGRRKVVPWR